jgi:cytochrome P450
MREEAPLYRNDRHDFWALTRFHDVLEVLADWKTYSSSQGPILEQIRGGRGKYAEGLLSEDPPIHDLHRQMLARAFTPRAVAQIENRVRGFAQRLLDERIGSGGFDFVEDYGARVPGMVIAAMLGTPDSDLDEIRRLTDAQLIVTEGTPFDRTQFDTLGSQLWDYFMDHIHARRKNPTGDLMSELVSMEFTDEKGVTRKVTDVEACQYIKLLSSAGNETTARFIGWAGATLARYPAQRAKLVARPELIPNGVEEILRFEPPAMALARVVTRDVVWHDQVVPKDSVMVVIQAATGRDQRQFPDPDPNTFDVERKIDRILSFGHGTHVCMGGPLARMEGCIVIEEMLKRFPEWDVEWDETEIVHTGSSVRGYSRLPILVP